MRFIFVTSAVALLGLSVQAQPFRSLQPPQRISGAARSIDSLLKPVGRPDSLIRIIVEFRDAPLFLGGAAPGFAAAQGPPQAQFDRFSADVQGLNAKAPPSAFHRTFTKTFFGVSLTVPASQLGAIADLSYVRSIHLDHVVTKAVTKSALQMGVPELWQSFETQGEGVRVGIIDTGIDYLHSALGGSFGPGSKVAGGYDFVNNDADPMDDDGHGTHVAGIIAALTDSIKGIAPMATLYSFKVLDNNGTGYESDVIAAIERAADPNNDGDPSDRLDVVNLSLGTDMGSSTDASSVAVNNASKLGILFCVAAGNSGYPQTNHQDNYFRDGSATIGSPGTAESAITVGAVDSLDVLALFSSKGPNRHGFGLKPDVVAPGVKILSTVLNQAYDRYNGTSMATPMVTGVVALLRAAHPDWTPERIKSAVTNTAKNIGISAYKQGAGRVQAMKAATSTAWIKPTRLGFGLDEPSLSMWTRQDTLYLLNAHASTQTFSSIVSGLQGGITLSLSPSGVSIPAGDSAMIVATLSVNNAVITVQDGDIRRFTGAIRFEGTVDTLSVPWAFARGTRLAIEFDKPSPEFIVYGGPVFTWSGDRSVFWPSLTRAELFGLSKISYGLMTVFPSATATPSMVIKNVPVSSDAETITINSTEATIPLLYKGVDQNGARLSTYPSAQKVLVTTIPFFGDWVTVFRTLSDTVRTSPVPANYTFRPLEYQFDASGTGTFHIVQYPPFEGIAAGKTMTNSPADFILQKFSLQYPPATSQAVVVGEFFTYQEQSGQGLLSGMGFEADTVSVSEGEVNLVGYFGKSSDARDAAVVLHAISDLSSSKLDYSTFPIMISQDSIVAITRDAAGLTARRSPTGGYMTFGAPPIHLFALWYNNVFAPSTLHFSTNFRGSQRETRYKDVDEGTYEIYDDGGNLVFSNPLNDFPRSPRTLSAGWHTAVMNSANHWLGSVAGNVKLTSRFNLAVSPANPPSVTSFQVLDANGLPTHRVPAGSSPSLLFSFLTINFIDEALPLADSTRAWYRHHGSEEWIPVPVQNIANDISQEGAVYTADLSAAAVADSTAIDLRIFAKGANGFSADYEISPAFGVGTWLGEFPIISTADVTGAVPIAFGLDQNFPNPFNPETVIRFHVAATGRVRLVIYDILGREIQTLANEVLSAGRYQRTWNASSLPSGMYFATLQAGGTMKTIKMVLVR